MNSNMAFLNKAVAQRVIRVRVYQVPGSYQRLEPDLVVE